MRDIVHALGLLFDRSDRGDGGTEVLAADNVDEAASVKLVFTADDEPRELDEQRREREHEDGRRDL